MDGFKNVIGFFVVLVCTLGDLLGVALLHLAFTLMSDSLIRHFVSEFQQIENVYVKDSRDDS